MQSFCSRSNFIREIYSLQSGVVQKGILILFLISNNRFRRAATFGEMAAAKLVFGAKPVQQNLSVFFSFENFCVIYIYAQTNALSDIFFFSLLFYHLSDGYGFFFGKVHFFSGPNLMLIRFVRLLQIALSIVATQHKCPANIYFNSEFFPTSK